MGLFIRNKVINKKKIKNLALQKLKIKIYLQF